MRKIRQILRLKFEHGLSNRKIAKSCRVSRKTVAEYVSKAKAAGLDWPDVESMDDTALERIFISELKEDKGTRPVPDWSYVHREPRGKGVTLMLLWQEYKERNPDGYQYR